MAFFGVILMKSGDACPADYFREAFFGRSKSFLRQKARAQKARKLGLSGLLASFPYINFALLIGQIYVLFRVLNDGFHLGKNPDLCTLLHEGEWGKRTPFCRREAVKPANAHRDNMQESQDYAADSVGLMKENQATGAAA